MQIGKYGLELTCGACPEQYDVFDEDGLLVGYLRLRHGNFTAQIYSPRGLEVYRAQPIGDGIFDADEREYYLTEAVNAIDDYFGAKSGVVEKPFVIRPGVEVMLNMGHVRELSNRLRRYLELYD